MKSTHSKDYRRIVAALVSARKAMGVRQAEVALALGKPQSFVSKIEGRERRLDIVEFVAICRIIGVNPLAVLIKGGLLGDEDLCGGGETSGPEG